MKQLKKLLMLGLILGSTTTLLGKEHAFSTVTFKEDIGNPALNKLPINDIRAIQNGGYFIQKNGWLYYTNTSQSGRLYKCQGNFSNKMQVSTEDNVRYLNIVGDTLYYSCDEGFVMSKLNGTNKQVLNMTVEQPCIVGEWIYYMSMPTGGYLYRMKLDGTQRGCLTPVGVSSFVSDGENIYYTLHNRELYMLRPKDQVMYATQVLASEKWFKLWDFRDGHLYVTKEEGIYKMTPDGKEETYLTEKGTDLVNGWAYFAEPTDGDKLYRRQLATGKLERLNDVKTEHMQIIGSYIYYENMYTKGVERLALK